MVRDQKVGGVGTVLALFGERPLHPVEEVPPVIGRYLGPVNELVFRKGPSVPKT